MMMGGTTHQRDGHLYAALNEQHATAKLIGGPQRDVGCQVVDYTGDYGGRQRSVLAGAQRDEQLRRVEDYRVYARPLRSAQAHHSCQALSTIAAKHSMPVCRSTGMRNQQLGACHSLVQAPSKHCLSGENWSSIDLVQYTNKATSGTHTLQ